MKKLVYFIVSLLILNTSFSQNKLKGKIIDAKSKAPLSGATVRYSGKNATTTDKDGNYSINCISNSSLVVSFIGYETLQQLVKNCNVELDFSLTPINQQLDNVEITATSSQNKSMLYQPVSIAKLNNTELKRSTGLYLDDAINTNVPGVIMQRRAISSGQQFNIRGYGNGIRGTNGISSNFDGQGSKVYLNGIAITDAEGNTH